jgi:hypothetical protein
MHTPSKLALETLAELQRQAIADFGLPTMTKDLVGDWAEISEMVEAEPRLPKPNWLAPFTGVFKALSKTEPQTPKQDLLDQSLILAAHDALVSRSAHISNYELPKAVVFGSLPIGQMNAITIEMEETGEYLVLFQSGLFGVLNLLAWIVAEAWPEASPPGGALGLVADGDTLLENTDEERAAARLNEILEHALILGNPRAVRVGQMARNYAGLKETILLHAEMFVIGHEFGHVTRHHFSVERRRETSGNLALTVQSRSRQEEFAADLSSLESMTAVYTQRPDQLWLSYLGACFFLTCQDVIEDALAAFPAQDMVARLRDSHPTGAQRRLALTNALRSSVGHQNAGFLENSYAGIQSLIDHVWARAKPDWEKLAHEAGGPDKAWRMALEPQDRPEDVAFEEEPADTMLVKLGFPTGDGLEDVKGHVMLPLALFFDPEGEDRNEAATWLLEGAHASMICLIHDLGRVPNHRAVALLDHLLTLKPELSVWLNGLRFTVERHAGNRDILGVPEILPEMAVGARYLQALAQAFLDNETPDYDRLYVEIAHEEHRRMFGR